MVPLRCVHLSPRRLLTLGFLNPPYVAQDTEVPTFYKGRGGCCGTLLAPEPVKGKGSAMGERPHFLQKAADSMGGEGSAGGDREELAPT